MWRLWDISSKDYLGIALGVFAFALFAYAAVFDPFDARTKRAEREFGPGWECSNAHHGICIKRSPVKSWPDTEVGATD
jgi:hypothetical protein